MSIGLDVLVSDLKADVPALDGVPTDEQYPRLVKDAVDEFSVRVGRVKKYTLSLVEGTATYDLPADFVRLVSMQPTRTLYLTAGELPADDNWEISDGQITFYHEEGNDDTPVTYSAEREIKYHAAWVLDGSDIYQDLTDREARIALLYAAMSALKAQADHEARKAWTYQVGDERVSKEKIAESLAARAEDRYKQYVRAANDYIRSIRYSNRGRI
jgi:hypothetical protein